MTGGKVTNPSWPDPTDWINSLYQEMSVRQSIYDQEVDPLLKRNKAGGMLGAVIAHLMALPAFKNDSVHLPLKDLMIFLSDLDRGRDHPWAAPVNFGGTNITTTSQAELKIWVRATYAILLGSGCKPVQAYRRIADGLTSSGRTGRNGKAVRWQTVQTWCRENCATHEEAIKEKLEKWWLDFRGETAIINVMYSQGKPVPEADKAGAFADLVWGLPHLRDQSFSGASE